MADTGLYATGKHLQERWREGSRMALHTHLIASFRQIDHAVEFTAGHVLLQLETVHLHTVEIHLLEKGTALKGIGDHRRVVMVAAEMRVGIDGMAHQGRQQTPLATHTVGQALTGQQRIGHGHRVDKHAIGLSRRAPHTPVDECGIGHLTAVA